MEKPAVKAVEKSNTNGPKSTDAVPAKAETTSNSVFKIEFLF
jgi:hypothetical protein